MSGSTSSAGYVSKVIIILSPGETWTITESSTNWEEQINYPGQFYLAVQVAALSMRVRPRVPLGLVDKEEDFIPIFLSLHMDKEEEDIIPIFFYLIVTL